MAKVFLLGDSTCAQKSPDVYPETGWGMCFGKHLAKGWTADNRAINGRSTKMFLDEGAFAACLSDLHGGDYGIIQFGHNENKMDEERHTEPWTSYSANLRYMAQSILQKGGHPVFVSPISRRNFLDGKYLMHTLGDYPQAMEAVARNMSLPFIDLTTPTRKEIEELGSLKSRKYFMHFDAGLYPHYPDGDADDTHLRPEGAEAVAALLSKLLFIQYPDLPFIAHP
ncbi:MAG: rhamnogalacturonan acetylesterase [Sphaerochaetaceae bacterium]|jgi:lysophospholipase L1-like esterase